MHILGLSAMGRDSTAALLGDPGIVAAIEEGKLERTRSIQGIPRAAIRFCMSRAAIDWPSVDRIAVASRPGRAWTRQAILRTRLAPLAPVSSGYFLSKAFGELGRELNNLRILRAMAGKREARVESFDHHLCHAASAFYASAFDTALIVTLDEQGDARSGFAGSGEGTRIRELESIRFPHSLAWVYTQVTRLLGFHPRGDEHKTQWLSLTGEPAFADFFLEILRSHPNSPPHLNTKYFSRSFSLDQSFSSAFCSRLGISPPAVPQPRSKSPGTPPQAAAPPSDHWRANIAASLQQACSTVVCDWLEALRRKTKARLLCLAGGLFLNPLLVSSVERRTGFDAVFVQPAAGNEGTSLGAAWLAWHQSLRRPRVDPMPAPYFGPAYSNQDVKTVLDNCKASYRWCDSDDRKVEDALRLLEAGKIVAWFQGGAEFGPRALGNRSLLASPWAPYVKENLNDYVKHRESFRPFALSMPAEDAGEYFDFTANARFMTTMAVAKEKGTKLLESLPPGFLLPGKLVRLHTVTVAENPLFWKLLKRSGEKGAAPMLVNTSFNLFGEPLVIRPREAVRSYFCSGADALVAGSFLLTKT